MRLMWSVTQQWFSLSKTVFPPQLPFSGFYLLPDKSFLLPLFPFPKFEIGLEGEGAGIVSPLFKLK